MKNHRLKTWPDPFQALWDGRKTFEWRQEDGRDFQVGDTLELSEWIPENKTYTGRFIRAEVTYVLHGGRFGVPEGFKVMSVKVYQHGVDD